MTGLNVISSVSHVWLIIHLLKGPKLHAVSPNSSDGLNLFSLLMIVFFPMFNNAYKHNFAVFTLIFSNLFPQNNVGINPIICDIFFHFNILTTAKFTGISVVTSRAACAYVYRCRLPKIFEFNLRKRGRRTKPGFGREIE